MKRQVHHEKFTITRTYPVNPAEVFSAFSDPSRKRRWFAEGDGYIVDSYELDFRVGGFETSAFRIDNPGFKSAEVSNYTSFFDIIPDERIIMAYSMSNVGTPFSVSLQTLTFEPDGTGTRLTLTEQITFMEGADGTETRRYGTEALLDNLGTELSAGRESDTR